MPWRTSRVYVARKGGEIVATLRLATKKPWAIDTSYFTPIERPVYLMAMAVAPAHQRRGLGKRCFDEAKRIARALPADAIRLDAYDTEAGAGGFYARCGCTEMGRVVYRNTPLIYFERYWLRPRPVKSRQRRKRILRSARNSRLRFFHVHRPATKPAAASKTSELGSGVERSHGADPALVEIAVRLRLDCDSRSDATRPWGQLQRLSAKSAVGSSLLFCRKLSDRSASGGASPR